VEVGVQRVDGADLDGGGEADRVRGRRALRRRDAVDRVVVGERDQLDALRRRARDDLLGRQLAVGERGVRLQVEGRGAQETRDSCRRRTLAAMAGAPA